MATVPGTYFTKAHLEAALKVDNVSGAGRTGIDKLNRIGFLYHTENKKYDKALAWYILAARENHMLAPNGIGVLYRDGLGVQKNYLCALKWFLKAVQQNYIGHNVNSIGMLFENGHGVPLDKYKALEWYSHGSNKNHIDRMKSQGYHRSATDKKKDYQLLRKETEAILDAEKKKLEQKQYKTQEEEEALEQLKITYKLVDGGMEAWETVPILLAGSRQRDIKSVNSSVTNNEDEILELNRQIQLLKQDKNTFESQAKQLQQEKTNLELEIKEKDKELISLRNTLQSENNKLKLEIDSLENQLEEKDISFQTENQSLKHRIDAQEQENRVLKQERIQQQATIQNTGPSNNNINPTNIDPSHNDQHDDSYNDFNYEYENSDFDEGGANDINYDTPSEDESSNNDLDYNYAN